MIDFIAFVFWLAVWGIALGVGLLLILTIWIAIKANSPEEKTRLAAIEEQQANVLELKLQAERDRQVWFEEFKSKYERSALVAELSGQTSGCCAIALDSRAKALIIVKYTLTNGFIITDARKLSASDILSADIVRPTVTKTVTRKQSVPVVTSKNRSPFARGLVGGMLLGPAGLVLGAASGLNKEVRTTIKEQEVQETVEAPGEPELVIGTRRPEFPVFKFRFQSALLVEEWLYALRSTRGRSRR